MTKTYDIDIDCANCAQKVEEAVNKMDEVNSATVNFMTLKMTVDFDDSVSEKDIIKKIKKTGRKIDSDFSVE
jgi:copper chaperone CopZ